MLAGTIVYVYAGTQLGQFKISVGLVAAFVVLGIFPLVAKKVLDALKARKVYAKWQRPARFDRNMVVIGAGSAGLVSAYIAAAVKAKVTLIERHKMGGDCLNTGCVPSKPLTSDTVWDIRVQPKRLVVLGGGPIGCELAQAFARLGSKVTQVEMLPRILIKEDPEFSEIVAKRFRHEGIDVLTGHKAKEVRVEGGAKVVVVEHEGQDKRIECDEILCAVGRVANTKGYGLEE